MIITRESQYCAALEAGTHDGSSDPGPAEPLDVGPAPVSSPTPQLRSGDLSALFTGPSTPAGPAPVGH